MPAAACAVVAAVGLLHTPLPRLQRAAVSSGVLRARHLVLDEAKSDAELKNIAASKRLEAERLALAVERAELEAEQLQLKAEQLALKKARGEPPAPPAPEPSPPPDEAAAAPPPVEGTAPLASPGAEEKAEPEEEKGLLQRLFGGPGALSKNASDSGGDQPEPKPPPSSGLAVALSSVEEETLQISKAQARAASRPPLSVAPLRPSSQCLRTLRPLPRLVPRTRPPAHLPARAPSPRARHVRAGGAHQGGSLRQ